MIALIPARGGSKGLPRKNVKEICGDPLIAYSIKAALGSKYIEEVFVSTEDSEIADISIRFGAKVPFLRPKELATDTAKAIDTYIYTVDKLISEYRVSVDDLVVLLPTSPLRDSKSIDEAVELYKNKKAKTIISVVEAIHPPTWYKTITKEGKLNDFFCDVDNSLNRQESKNTYLPNGAIYIFDYKTLKANYSYYNNKTYAYVMTQEKSVDIDTLLDFKLAELLLIERGHYDNK